MAEYKYVSYDGLKHYTEALKAKFPDLTKIIDDAAKAATTTYSSNKIEELIKNFVKTSDLASAIINDTSTTAETSTWSAKKIYTMISGITGISFSKVAELPAASEAKTGVIYLIPITNGTGNNIYDEYVWVPDETYTAKGSYEKIGSTDINLSGYIKTTDITALSNTEIDTIISAVWSTTSDTSSSDES